MKKKEIKPTISQREVKKVKIEVTKVYPYHITGNLRSWRILKYNILVDFVESLRQRKLEYNV